MFGYQGSKRFAVSLIVVVLTLSAGASIVTRALRAETESLAASSKAGPSVAQFDEGPRQLIRVFMHGEDLYPDVVHAQPGRILLRAENETGLEVALIFERVLPGGANEALARVNTVGRAKRVDRELVVGAGEYVFYDETFPALKGKLIVEPR